MQGLLTVVLPRAAAAGAMASAACARRSTAALALLVLGLACSSCAAAQAQPHRRRDSASSAGSQGAAAAASTLPQGAHSQGRAASARRQLLADGGRNCGPGQQPRPPRQAAALPAGNSQGGIFFRRCEDVQVDRVYACVAGMAVDKLLLLIISDCDALQAHCMLDYTRYDLLMAGTNKHSRTVDATETYVSLAQSKRGAYPCRRCRGAVRGRKRYQGQRGASRCALCAAGGHVNAARTKCCECQQNSISTWTIRLGPDLPCLLQPMFQHFGRHSITFCEQHFKSSFIYLPAYRSPSRM